MDAKSTKVLDGAADNLKQNQATQNVAHLAGFLAPISVPANTRRTPRSPWIPFRVLLAAIRNMVPHNIMFQIICHYEQFLSKKISCDDFVWQLRLIVGDDIMTSAINKVKFKGPSYAIKKLKHQEEVKLVNEEAEISQLELTIDNMKL